MAIIRKLIINGDNFIVRFNGDGTATAECKKDKNGFHVIMNFTNDLNEHNDAMKAVGRFYAS
ncbi:hypothetical protein BRE01_60150 [Brevibacillus reuszeri]|uniref:Uncharacterized protein n=1 Tax=Brevibacillus reuszeri TaxID=54915 RepID=A0A0K9YPX8_9BACL|nr:hypothetical protein [Brevibacillus reuszeri]KNB70235.1 hypothetical protein ADS79_14810 [Brevibacillus reuszeri]MED1859192.1 hypothetical protein [Brevibacillus reuszeri]GED72313.1 hypothetical protein BRE01_60150 [Brevibacillus reuszeri]